MEQHHELSDREFEDAFEQCSLPENIFNHEAHLRLAWIHIRQYGLIQAIENLKRQIRRYAASVNAPEKYHDTLTVAAAYIIHHCMQQSHSTDFQNFLLEFPKLRTSFKSLIGAHYSDRVLMSKEARQKFMVPDCAPF